MIKDRATIGTIVSAYNNGAKVKEIAASLNKVPATIYSILYREGVTVRPVGRPVGSVAQAPVELKIAEPMELAPAELRQAQKIEPKKSLKARLKDCRDRHVALSTKLEAEGLEDNSAYAYLVAKLLTSLINGEAGETIEL